MTVEAYGPGADRFGELWRPAGDGPWPVVVLLHGGFWRAQRTLELMRPLDVELVELPGVDHMAVIDPASPAWAEVTRRLGRFT